MILGSDQKEHNLWEREWWCAQSTPDSSFFLARSRSLSTSLFQIMKMNMRHWGIKNHIEENLKLKAFFKRATVLIEGFMVTDAILVVGQNLQ